MVRRSDDRRQGRERRFVHGLLTFTLAALLSGCPRTDPLTNELPGDGMPRGLGCVSGPRVFDAGVVEAGETVEHTFVLENAGSKAVDVASYRSSCGCTVVSGVSLPAEIPPHGSATFRIGVDTARGPGPFEASVELLDRKQRAIAILAVRMRIDVRLGVAFVEPSLQMGAWGTEAGRFVKTSLRVFASSPEPPRIGRVLLASTNRWKATARLEDAAQAKAGGRSILDVPIELELDDWPRSGAMDDRLDFDVVVNGRRFQPHLRVRASAPRLLAVGGQGLFLGVLQRGAAFEVETPLAAPPDGDLRLESDLDWLRVDLVPAPNGRSVIRATGRTPRADGPIDGTLQVLRGRERVETIRVVGAVK